METFDAVIVLDTVILAKEFFLTKPKSRLTFVTLALCTLSIIAMESGLLRCKLFPAGINILFFLVTSGVCLMPPIILISTFVRQKKDNEWKKPRNLAYLVLVTVNSVIGSLFMLSMLAVYWAYGTCQSL